MTLFNQTSIGYLGHKYQIAQGKIQIQRERLLDSIAKIEQILSFTIEQEFMAIVYNEMEEENDQEDEKTIQIGNEINKTSKRTSHQTVWCQR